MTLPFKASQLATQRLCGLVDGRFLVARANEGNAASPTTASSSLEGAGRLDSGKQERLKKGPGKDEQRCQDWSIQVSQEGRCSTNARGAGRERSRATGTGVCCKEPDFRR